MKNTEIRIDIHGMFEIEAQKYIISKLNKIDDNVVKIIVVHGYNDGKVLRDLVRNKIKHKKIKHIRPDNSNPGVTIYDIKSEKYSFKNY